MKWLIDILIILAIALVAVFYLNSSGYVLIYLPTKAQISLEMTFWTFLIASLLVVAMLFLLYKLYSWVLRLFEPKLEKRAFKASKKSNAIILQALAAFSYADFKGANAKFEKAFKLTSSSANALLLFFGNLKQQKFDQAREILQKEFDQYSELKLLGEGLLFLEGESISASQIDVIIKNLAANRHTNILFEQILFRIYQRQLNFYELLNLLNSSKLTFLTQAQKDYERLAVMQKIIVQLSKDRLEDENIGLLAETTSTDELLTSLSKNIALLKEDLYLFEKYLLILQKEAKFELVETIIKDLLAKDYIGFLLEFYINSPLSDFKSKLTQISRWRKIHGDKTEIILALARIYTKLSDFEQAEVSYLEVYKRDLNRNIAFELAEFFASQNKMEKSLNFLHQAKVFSNEQS